MTETAVRALAEEYHTNCTGNYEPVEDAFCTCWGKACKTAGPCGDCYVCRSVPTGQEAGE